MGPDPGPHISRFLYSQESEGPGPSIPRKFRTLKDGKMGTPCIADKFSKSMGTLCMSDLKQEAILLRGRVHVYVCAPARVLLALYSGRGRRKTAWYLSSPTA